MLDCHCDCWILTSLFFNGQQRVPFFFNEALKAESPTSRGRIRLTSAARFFFFQRSFSWSYSPCLKTPPLVKPNALSKNQDIDLPTSTKHKLPATSSCTSTTRPTSAMHNNRPAAPIYDSTNVSYPHRTSSCTYLRLDQRQLPALNIQLHLSTTRPTSATRTEHSAAPIYDSTNVSYPHRTSSCTYLRLDQRQLPATKHPAAPIYDSTNVSLPAPKHPAAPIYDSTNVSYPQRTSSCTYLRLDQRQLPAPNIQLHLSTTRPNVQLPAPNIQLHLSTTRPTSATRNEHPAAPIYDSTNVSYPHRTSSCTYLRLDQRQLPAPNIQLHLSTTRPTSATRTEHPAALIYDSANVSYPHRTSSCTYLRLDQHQLPAPNVQLHLSTTQPSQLLTPTM